MIKRLFLHYSKEQILNVAYLIITKQNDTKVHLCYSYPCWLSTMRTLIHHDMGVILTERVGLCPYGLSRTPQRLQASVF